MLINWKKQIELEDLVHLVNKLKNKILNSKIIKIMFISDVTGLTKGSHKLAKIKLNF